MLDNQFFKFYKGKKVFITGHSGFKGGWLTLWLERLGAVVAGASLPPEGKPNLFELARIRQSLQNGKIKELLNEKNLDKGIQNGFCDICKLDRISALIQAFEPEIVFHLAAQPLVLTSYKEPVMTCMTNIMGAVHVLEALRNLPSVKAVVMVTTDKVYHDNKQVCPYREEDRLGGYDPYSSSKAAVEILVSSYRDSFLRAQNVSIATARAGNVIGGGDWSANRLIPDAIQAWQKKEPLIVRYPGAIRPWQHVLEPLAGYLLLAQRICHDPSLAGAWNLGPKTDQDVTVRQIVEVARRAYGNENEGGSVEYCDERDDLHETNRLTLETAKARCLLGFQPEWEVETAVQKTIEWYKQVANGYDARQLCLEQISEYEAGS